MSRIYMRHNTAPSVKPPFETTAVVVPWKAPVWREEDYGYAALLQWAVASHNMNRRLKDATHALRRVMDEANSVGQLVRLVPNIRTVLPDRAKAVLQEQQRASRLGESMQEVAAANQAALRDLNVLLPLGALTPAPSTWWEVD